MDQRRNLQAYANEKLSAAVEKLATHPEEVRIRLRVAVTESLWLVPAPALPTDLRLRFEAIMADLTKFKPSPEYAFTPEKGFGRTALSVTLQKIRKSTAAEIASRIVQLQSELEWRLEHSEGKAITSPPTPSRGRHQRRRKTASRRE